MEWVRIITESSGTIASVALFIWYLVQANKQSSKNNKEFMDVMECQRKEFVKTVAENNKVVERLKREIERLSEKIGELTKINHSIYQTLVKKTRRMEEAGLDPVV